MRVEIQIDPAMAEPYVVLHIPKLTAEISAIIESLECADSASPVMAAKKDDKAYVIPPDQVELIRTEGGSVALYDRAGHDFIVEKPLREVLQRLGNDFVRISKSAIVNIRRIDHVSPSFNGTMNITMKNGLNDYISRKFLGDFKKRLGL